MGATSCVCVVVTAAALLLPPGTTGYYSTGSSRRAAVDAHATSDGIHSAEDAKSSLRRALPESAGSTLDEGVGVAVEVCGGMTMGGYTACAFSAQHVSRRPKFGVAHPRSLLYIDSQILWTRLGALRAPECISAPTSTRLKMSHPPVNIGRPCKVCV